MTNKIKATQENHTSVQHFYQVKLPLELDTLIPPNDSVRLLLDTVERMDMRQVIQSYSHIEKSKASPRQLLAIFLYAFMEGIYSYRDMEKSCKRDINFLYILDGKPAPDHTTIQRFVTRHLTPFLPNLNTQLINFLADSGELSLSNLFVDGTIIEANANKYTYVWKPSVIKNMEKMMAKVGMLFEKAEESWNIHISRKGNIRLRHMKRLYKKLKTIQRIQKIPFVYGPGRKRSPLQKMVEELQGYITRMKQYISQIHRCGERSSFSKTDPDATFMRTKDDALKKAQLKPAYNVQFAVDSEFIVWTGCFQNPADMTTFIPFLEEMRQHIGCSYQNIVADAGYESEENYQYLKDHAQKSFIKTKTFEQRKTKKYKEDIGRSENMTYDPETDEYTCANGKKLRPEGLSIRKSATGFRSEVTKYECKSCRGCPLKEKCIRRLRNNTPLEERNKRIEVAKRFHAYRKENFQRLNSPEGKQLRLNRSIQVEGAFAELKENMKIRRFQRRGLVNVETETMLLSMAYNINLWHRKRENGRSGKYLYELKEIA